ncbi:MAG: AAA family ATPase [Rhodospirillales bacterium]
MIVEDQASVIAFLASPETFGSEVDEVDRIETHISLVFLAGDRVFKLKRAVKFPYLDFSSADLRREACENEVRVNRRTAPDIYLGVVAVTRSGSGRLALGGDGEPVDWLVEMKRFDQGGLFDRLAQDRALDPVTMERLAEAIAAFHRVAEVLPQSGGRALIDRVIGNNDTCFAEIGERVFASGDVRDLKFRSLACSDRLAALLDDRARDGRVRHCHGDLHLRNIVLIDGRPTLFDAIEFSRDLSEIDVLYDLAFLVMDLDHRQLRPLGNIATNRYLDIMEDTAGLSALPLFLSVRAAVRAHVSAATASSQSQAGKAETLVAEAQAYLKEALDYLEPSAPAVLAVGGLSGSGKSRLARELAPMLGRAPGARIARSDVLRKRLAGIAIDERLGPEGYTATMGRKTYDRMYRECETAVKAGQWAVADAVFARPEQRKAIEDVADALGVPFYGLWLDAPESVLKTRVDTRVHDASDADRGIVERQMEYDLGAIAWDRIDSGRALAETVQSAKAAMGFEGRSGDS